MELLLERKIKDDQTTIGTLSIDGVFECYTLEDRDRGLNDRMLLSDIAKVKVPHYTAIPTGRYEVAINYSERFKRLMPVLLNVPGYAGVRIHWGNQSKDTDGCILTGQTESADFVGNSVAAFDLLFARLTTALKTEKVYITIKTMELSENGIALIKSFEGLRLNAYRDAAGVWTIGYGSTRYHDGKQIKPGDKLANETQAAALLNNTLGSYVDAVNRRAKVDLNQNQFDALVSFLYNEGTAAGTTLFLKLNAGDYQGAADQFLVWNKITDPITKQHVVSNTLVKRCTEERAYFLKPI